MRRRVSRRDLLKIGAACAASAALGGCEFPPPWVQLEPYVRPPEQQISGVATWYASTCRQCPAGCGIIVRIMNGRALKIEGNPEHPLNQGKLCPRGQAGLQVLYNPDRLQGPAQQARRGSRQFGSLGWTAAVGALAAGLQQAGSRIAIWVDSTISGHLLDLFQRFAAAVGAPPPIVFDLYTALQGYHALATADQGLFGRPDLPTYALEEADIVYSFGADLLGTWLSTTHYGVAFGSLREQPLQKRGYLAHLEPRSSITAAKADFWLPIRPGTDALVAQALARLIADEGSGPPDRVARARAWASGVNPAAVAALAGVPLGDLERLARTFVSAARPLAIPGSALTGQGDAVQSAAAVQVLNIIAGESGFGLSPVPAVPGFVRPMAAPYGEVQTLIARMQAGEVRALLVYGPANPAYALPLQAGFVQAVQQVPLVVSFRPIVDETAVLADLLLPDRTYLEAWGYDVVAPSFGTAVVNSQQPVVTPISDTRATADVLLAVAKSIPAAAQALPWPSELAFLRETVARLPPGVFDEQGLGLLWATFLQHGFWQPVPGPAAAPPQPGPAAPPVVPLPQTQGGEPEFPFFLYLYMPVLLSDGRGASQPWLQGGPDPMTTIAWQTWVEIHPDTARTLGITYGDVVRVTSPHGSLEAPAYLFPTIRRDTVGIPIGQGHTDLGRFARDRGANPMLLVGPLADASGSSLAWSNLRVSVVRTGRWVPLAKFENTQGVVQGFVNEAFPEQVL